MAHRNRWLLCHLRPPLRPCFAYRASWRLNLASRLGGGTERRCEDGLEGDIAALAREITSRHRVDRRSLLPPHRVMPERGMLPGASAETLVAALGPTELA